MSLMRRRMMAQAKHKIIFSGLSIAKCVSRVGGYDVDDGIRFDFYEMRDQYAILDLWLEAGKSYELEFDFEGEKDVWSDSRILNVYYGSQWYLNKGCCVEYLSGNVKYHLDIEPYTQDRRVAIIGNAYGTATGYSIFRNLIIKEV